MSEGFFLTEHCDSTSVILGFLPMSWVIQSRIAECHVNEKKSNFGQLVVSMTNAVIGKETKVTVQVIHTFHNEPRSFFKQIFTRYL